MSRPNKPNAAPHLQRMPPKPMRKAGLHGITESIPTSHTKAPVIDPAVRAREFDARLRAMGAGTPPADPPVRNSTVDHKLHPYVPAELAPSVRPGAMDAKALPSKLWQGRDGGEEC